MRRATVCTPVLAERVAAGRSRPALRVVHTGMGPRRTLRHRARYDGDGPLAVLGVAGGLADGVRVGDVVVASEVRRDGVVTDCPAAALLAGELRRAGFTVHVGPVVTTDRLARGRSLDRLAATGALAVDMESAVVAEGAGDRP